MKNKLFLNTLRGVKKNPGRFIAITAIAAISCAFYSGVKASCPDMKNSGWKYYEDYSLADVQIKSTLGFNEGDAEKITDNFGFPAYEGYSADLLMDGVNGQAPVKVLSYDASYPLNKSYLIEGRFPVKSGECLADADASGKVDFKVGDRIVLSADEGDELEDILHTSEYTVVGLAKSPLYVSFERGSTTIGNGSLSAFVYVPAEDFAYDLYTDIYVKVPQAHESSVKPFSEKYENIVSDAEELLENIMEAESLSVRADEIRADVEEELADARQQLADGEKKLSDGKADYDKGLDEYNKALGEFNDAKEQYESALKEYNDGLASAGDGEETLRKLADTCPVIDGFLAEYENTYLEVLPESVLTQIKDIQQIYDDGDVDARIKDLLAVYAITDPAKDPVSKATAKQAIQTVNEQVRAASAGALTELETNKAVLEETGKLLEETGAELDEYEKEMNKAKSELDDAKKKLDDAQAEIDDANAEIDDAMQEVEDTLADAKLYVWNRDEFNPGCMGYGTDAERVDSIAAVFPIFFIVVAALVCCTTMSRMVEADRTEAGTMKALGFSSREIIMQYVLYAACAGLVGSVIGVIIGFPLLPNIIYKCYGTMYRYPFFDAKFMPDLAAVCITASVLCTVLSTVYTAVKELRAVPAELIRPKPPKEGKRIFLENIGFIWKNMKFTSKVSFRNLFRYKSRLFMTVIGICGCTALLLTAFGLREAIACIVDRQYNDISVYDAIAVISDKADEEETAEIYAVSDNEPLIIDRMNAIQETYGASSAMVEKKTDCYVFTPEDTDRFSEYIVLRDRKSGRPIELQDGKAVITEKLAGMLGVSVGDEVYLGDDKTAVTISDITENYAFHYLYMNRTTYDEVLGGKEWNTILFRTDGTPPKEDRDRIASDLISCDGVVSASFMYDGADSFRKLVKSLDLIVVVLILFSGALAFVILFNLANININERIRELATIKVLGFFDNEVGAYIYRESTVSAVMGILSGLVLGIFFERFVVKTAEVNEVMFSPDIPVYCFLLAALFMALFTVLVNGLLHFKIKKIDMAASMKAIE